MLKAVNSNNILGVKKVIGAKEFSIPRVAIKTLWGYTDEERVKLEHETKMIEELDTQKMNPLELACVRGYSDILSYYVEELNLKHKGEFNSKYEYLPIEELPFIYVPIVAKYPDVFKILLSIPTLWTYEDLRQISIFLKHVKWREGYQIFFRSQAVSQ